MKVLIQFGPQAFFWFKMFPIAIPHGPSPPKSLFNSLCSQWSFSTTRITIGNVVNQNASNWQYTYCFLLLWCQRGIVGVVGQNKNLATTSSISIINFCFDETWQGKNKSMFETHIKIKLCSTCKKKWWKQKTCSWDARSSRHLGKPSHTHGELVGDFKI